MEGYYLCIFHLRISIRPTDFTGARVTSTRYYTKIHTYLKSRFNLMLIPVIGNDNVYLGHYLT